MEHAPRKCRRPRRGRRPVDTGAPCYSSLARGGKRCLRVRRRILYNRVHARPPALAFLPLQDPVSPGLGSLGMSATVAQAAGVSPGPRQRRSRGAPVPRGRGRRAVRRRVARPLRDRRVDLPDRAGRRTGAEERRRRAHGDRDLPRAGRAGAPARRRQLAVRADRRRRAGDRLQQAPRAHQRFRPRSDDGVGGARRGPRPAQRVPEAARPVVPGRCQHVGAGDARRHGRQQFLRLALDRLRQHGAQRARDRRGPVRRHRGAFRPRARDGGGAPAHCRAPARAARDRRAGAGRDRAQRAEGAAARRRLQHRRLLSAERAPLHRGRERQLRASAGRQRRHARVVARAHAEARAAAGAPGAGRGQLPDAVQGDGERAAPRRLAAVGGGARRPDDDRPRARQPRVPRGDRPRADRRARRDPAGRVHRRHARGTALAACAISSR